jgi:hypothetical protein
MKDLKPVYFTLQLITFIFSMFLLSSCEAIGDIFQAGMWVGVVAVVLFVGIIFWVLGKLRGR